MVKFVTIEPFHKSVETIVTDLTIQTIAKYLTKCYFSQTIVIYLTMAIVKIFDLFSSIFQFATFICVLP